MDVPDGILAPEVVRDPLASARALAPRLLLRFAEYRWLLAAVDLIAVNGALLASLSRQSGSGVRWRILVDHPLWFVLMSALWLLLAHAFDAYDLGIADRLLVSMRAVVRAGVLTTLAYLFIPYFTPPLPPSRLAMLSLPVLVVPALLGGRAVCAAVLRTPVFQRRVLIVGTGWAARTVAQALSHQGRGSYTVVGFIRDLPENPEGTIVLDGQEGGADRGRQIPTKLPVFGDARAMTLAAARYGISTLVLATPETRESSLLKSLTDCAERGIEVITASSLYEQLCGRVPVEQVGKNWYVDLPVEHAGSSPLLNPAKRAMDVLLAGLGLLCLGLILPVIALAIYLDSPGPIFYAQERVGKGGRIFRILKFRSMVHEAERGEALWAQEDDSRITAVGHFLRATHLDEFPQFLNVLKGDMSAIGPRPERPEILRELTAQIPLYRLRHAIKPGMAGWALVKHGYARTNHDALMRLQYDLYYMKHQSVWLDLVILLKTIGRAVAFKGR